MSLLARVQKRALTEKEWMAKALRYNPSSTGREVTISDSMRIAAVYACIRVIAETLGSVPFVTYKRLPADLGKEIDPSYHLYDILHERPNPEQIAMEFRETLTASALTHGDGFAEIVYDGSGRVRELWPLLAGSMEVFRDPSTKAIKYLYTLDSGEKRALRWEQVFHLRNFGGDSLRGYSTIRLFREALALALATEEYGGRFFNNNSRPSGVLESPRAMSTKALERLRDSWEKAHKGLENSHRTAILEGGVTWKPMAMSNNDAQFILARKFQIAEIARIYRVPLHMIGELDKATFSNIEHQGIEFTTHTVRPWATRWEQTTRRDLYDRQPGARTHFSEHNLEGLLRGATKERYDAYHQALTDGWQSVNEVRRRENLNPVPGGDDLRTPLNMAPINEESPAEPEPDAVPDEEIEQNALPSSSEVIAMAYRILRGSRS